VEVFNIANFNNKKDNDLPINDQIRVGEVMLIGPNGEQMGTKPLDFAKQIANAAGLDLVLMNPGNERPVAKIMDYNGF
jgi:translation initiation factor IF-3